MNCDKIKQCRELMKKSIEKRIQKEIFKGFLKPGMKVNIARLKEHYQISLAPLREALNSLASKGLLIAEKNKGFRVPDLTKSELLEIMRISSHLEYLAIEQTMMKATTAWKEKLKKAYSQLEQVETTETPPLFRVWVKHNRKFHSVLKEKATPILTELMQYLLYKEVRYARSAFEMLELPYKQFQKEHEALYKAVMDQDKKGVLKALNDHYKTSTNILITQLELD